MKTVEFDTNLLRLHAGAAAAGRRVIKHHKPSPASIRVTSACMQAQPLLAGA